MRHNRSHVSRASRSKWKDHSEAVPYDEEVVLLSDGSMYRPVELKGGLLVVRRATGRRFNAVDGEQLAAEEFQLRMAGHRKPDGSWDPLRLYRFRAFDPTYLSIGRDRDPQGRLRWLAERGLTP